MGPTSFQPEPFLCSHCDQHVESNMSQQVHHLSKGARLYFSARSREALPLVKALLRKRTLATLCW